MSEFVKMKEEKVIVDDELVVRFEDNSTQPIKRIKEESTDPDPERSKGVTKNRP